MELDSEQIPEDDVQSLIWAMLDEQISEDEFKRLEELLRGDEAARRLYVQCVQMHVDLQHWFGAQQGAGSPGKTGLPLDLPAFNGDFPLADPAL